MNLTRPEQNYYKGLFVALISQQVPVAQWVSTMVCNADAVVRPLLRRVFFVFFLTEVKFYSSFSRRSFTRAEGPSLERPSRRSLVRAEGPILERPSRRSLGLERPSRRSLGL